MMWRLAVSQMEAVCLLDMSCWTVACLHWLEAWRSLAGAAYPSWKEHHRRHWQEQLDLLSTPPEPATNDQQNSNEFDYDY